MIIIILFYNEALHALNTRLSSGSYKRCLFTLNTARGADMKTALRSAFYLGNQLPSVLISVASKYNRYVCPVLLCTWPDNEGTLKYSALHARYAMRLRAIAHAHA